MTECLLSAFGHLVVSGDAGAPDFTISIWDSAAGLQKPPTPAWNDARIMYPPELLRNASCKVHLQFNPNRLSAVDLKNNLAIYWTQDPGRLPWYEKVMPLKTILYWFLSSLEIQVVHAAAVETDGQAALLCGPSGSGKSTTAMACLARGMNLLSDDYCAADTNKPATVFSLYDVVKLTSDTFSKSAAGRVLDTCKSLSGNDTREKAVYSLHPSNPEKLRSRARAKVLLHPVIGNCMKTSIQKIDPNELARSMFSCLRSQQVSIEESDFFRIIRLTKTLPCYKVHLGSDLEEIVDTVKGALL